MAESVEKERVVVGGSNLNPEGLASTVAAHYNTLKAPTMAARNESRILHLRNFNNFMKSFLIGKCAAEVRDSFPRWSAIDLACGKGGDMLKWDKAAGLSHLVCVDIAKDSVATCKERYDNPRGGRRRNYTAEFIVADCTRVCFQALLASPARKVQLVSCQFALHYGWESLPQAATIIRNAAASLQPGGRFVCTLPDANYILKLVENSADKRSFKNEVFGVRFPECRRAKQDDENTSDDKAEDVPPARRSLFGNVYHFWLEGAVDCPEFLVHQDTLKTLCARAGLRCVYQKRFREVFQEAMASPCNGLLSKMRGLEQFPRPEGQSGGAGEYGAAEMAVQDGQKRVLTMSTSEWQAADLYTAMVFEKIEKPRERQEEAKSSE